MIRALLFFMLVLLGARAAIAQTCVVPNILQNGTIADAAQTMDNFNTLSGCIVGLQSNPAGYFQQFGLPPAALVSWLNSNIVLGKNPYGYLGKFGMLVVPTTHGEPALVGASRTSDTPAPNVCCSMGVAAIGLNDNTTTPQSGWMFYGSGTRLPGTGSFQNEYDLFNAGSLVTSNSYSSPSGQTIVAALQCGGEPVAAGLVGNHCSAAATIGNNGDSFNEGIVCKNNAISGPNETCFEMTGAQSIIWSFDSTGPAVFGAQISSLVGSGANAMSQIFSNNGVQWWDNAGHVSFLIANNPGATVVNYLSTQGMATGNPAVLFSAGTDANVDIELFTQGPTSEVQTTNGLSIGTHVAAAALEYALGFKEQASPSGLAPGANKLKIEVAPGTSGGTCRLVIYAGTSSSGITPSGFDNLGAGC